MTKFFLTCHLFAIYLCGTLAHEGIAYTVCAGLYAGFVIQSLVDKLKDE